MGFSPHKFVMDEKPPGRALLRGTPQRNQLQGMAPAALQQLWQLFRKAGAGHRLGTAELYEHRGAAIPSVVVCSVQFFMTIIVLCSCMVYHINNLCYVGSLSSTPQGTKALLLVSQLGILSPCNDCCLFSPGFVY